MTLRPRRLIVGMLGGVVLSGCHTATRVVDYPRVDLELSGGNRGYLVGAPPAAWELKSTREMVEAEFEVPTRSRSTSGATQAGTMTPSEHTSDTSGDTATSAGGGPETSGTYVVQQGDSLWTIAAKPDVFGDGSKWHKLLEANRDVLKSADRLHPGMTLRIPHRDATPEPAQESAQYTK